MPNPEVESILESQKNGTLAERRPDIFQMEWIAACKGQGPAPGSNFVDHAADLTEFVLLGNVAIRCGQPIEWDAARMTCSNLPEADRFVRKSYRIF